MLTRLAAQALTDGFAALALGAIGLGLVRRRKLSPLEVRLACMVGGLCVFCAARAVSEVIESRTLILVTQIVAALLPIAGLALAEGLLRRHAPHALKLLTTFGALALVVLLIASGGTPPVSSWGLGGFILVSTSALIVLLLTRNRTSLSQQENASIDALMFAAIALIALSMTDFLPIAPVGMGGIGAAVLAFCAHLNPTSPSGVRRAMTDFLVVGLIATASAFALSQALAIEDVNGMTRLGVVVLAMVVAVLALRDALGERVENDGLALRQALARCDTSNLAAFLDSLAGQPLLRGLRLAEGDALTEYDVSALGNFLARRSVWTRASIRGVSETDSEQGQDQLADLMARTQSSHAALITLRPVRIALLTLPEMGDAGGATADLALFRKLAALAAEREA